ncbi:type II toxin-antitoxin system VapC family toxin [Mucilaginibacter sp. Mucisp86]|uniref:type II toxin-antitoxin system VapC family toxin n=1 Tax=Mucilaginibacter sp. Mucisp86 TaxID=3243060 RepID=UPI0039B36656
MSLLLDTHALIWFTEGSNRLSTMAKTQIEGRWESNFVSIVSLWEIVIKTSKTKLEIKKSFVEINQFLLINNIHILDVKIDHLNTLLILPHHHGDPFDRLIISQAISENLTIISADQHFKAYPVSVLW